MHIQAEFSHSDRMQAFHANAHVHARARLRAHSHSHVAAATANARPSAPLSARDGPPLVQEGT
eukprot:5574320-Pleurochrysis_carterae.AAC.1